MGDYFLFSFSIINETKLMAEMNFNKKCNLSAVNTVDNPTPHLYSAVLGKFTSHGTGMAK